MKNIKVLTAIVGIFLAALLSGCSQDSGSSRPTFNEPPSNGGPSNGCIAVDTDGDGLRDCQDPDIDNDGYLNEVDAFPYDKMQWTDSDGDGVGDNCYYQDQAHNNVWVLFETQADPQNPSTMCQYKGYNGTWISIDLEHCNRYDQTISLNWQGDWSENDSAEWKDSDGDGLGDNADPDDDNDGVPDFWDAFRLRSSEQFDIDFDSLGNIEDPDADNDGVPDVWDDIFWKAGGFDIDHDLLPSESDPDFDGDNVVNEADAFPYDSTESVDTDGDKVGNNADHDDDNDGVPDVWDDYPLDRNYYYDSDGDGYANEIDAFPYDATEWVDSDNDGYGDNKDAFPNNPNEWSDTDSDGLGDNSDPDIDNDGYLNQLPAVEVQQVECYQQLNETSCLNISGCAWTSQGRCAPLYSCLAGGYESQCDDAKDSNQVPLKCKNQPYPKHAVISPSTCNLDTGCTWNGSICEQHDFFPFDKFEQLDSDYDGLGNNQDPDDDNDGFPDAWDDFPYRKDAFLDFDVDGIYDWQLPSFASDMASIPAGQYAWKIDPDSDNDGVPDFWDDMAWDPAEYYDIDHDSIGDNFDSDDDGDGITDAQDAFPYDPTEWADTNNNGIGNNADPDDDNDGVPDVWDTAPLNNIGFSDIDGDGDIDGFATTDVNASGTGDIDVDGDTVANYALICTGSVNNFTCSFPNSDDKFIYDSKEAYDYDLDGLGDNEDPDDDNDGVPDNWDDFPIRDGYADLNNNGIINEEDPDIDGDGVINEDDLYPYDPTEWADTDGDTLPDNLDPDADNDGVPDNWDDFKTDVNYWADSDLDGIPNELDIYTPFGINSEADLDIALSHNENVALTSSFSISTCKNLTKNQFLMYSPEVDDIKTLTFNSPDDSCMFTISANQVAISGVRFLMPEGKRGVFFKTTANGVSYQSIFQNDFVLEGVGKIADLTAANLVNFTRNNVVFKTKVDRGTQGVGYDSLIEERVSTGIATDADTGILFDSNIIFWDIEASQTVPIYFYKAVNSIRSLTAQYNAISVQKPSGVNLIAGSAFFKFDILGSNGGEYKGVQVGNNRVNMNNSMQLFYLTNNDGTLNPGTDPGKALIGDRILCKDNQIYGITDLGSSLLNFDYIIEDAVCDATNETACEEKSYCDWSTGSNSCINNGTYAPSFGSYYNFKPEDVFIAPDRGQYWMHYFPNTDKVNNSPALFTFESYDIFFEVYLIQASSLGGNDNVYYIGVYPPILDQDLDLFPDDEDKFPNEPTEWYDNDNDGIGNNADPDDDNDQVMDSAEKSYCAAETGYLTCNVKTGCNWDTTSNACRHIQQGCLVAGSTWSYASLCCVNGSNQCVDGSDPFVADTDGDGLNDYAEMYTYGTNPLLEDTDGDGDTDAQEISNGTNPLDPLSSKDTDGDGLTDNYETSHFAILGCVNPQLTADTDGDGLTDYQEDKVYHTNPCVADTDGDGLTDYEEINTYNTNPNLMDTDGDGLTDGAEVLTYGTNPTIADTDGDGAKDGQEVIDGTDPLLNTSFKDTDGDGESDYADKTPYGTVPCDNTNLAACTNTYTANELRDRFNLQLTESLNCGTKTSSVACTANVFDLCKWNSGNSTCEPKDVVVFNNLTLNDRCYTTVIAANNKTTNVTIRTKPGTRKTLTMDDGLYSLCNNNPTNFSAGEGVFTLLANTGLTFTNIDFLVGPSIPTLIGNTAASSRGGFSLSTNKVSFNSQRTNGGAFIKLRDFAKVDLEQSTVRQRLLGTSGTVTPTSAISIKNSGALCASLSQTNCNISSAICQWNGISCVDNNTSSLIMKGNIFSCETESALSSLYSNGLTYNCVDTQSRTTEFDGNIVMLDDVNGLSGIEVEDVNNNLRSWNHVQGNGSLVVRNSRIYSKSKTFKVDNSSSSVTSSNMSVRDGENSSAFDWTGPQAPTVAQIPVSTVYDTFFTSTTSSQLTCQTGTSGDYSTIHPGYFNPSPLRSFWSLVNRTGPADAVQIPGAVGQLCTP